jgi:cell volume regulation protein A
MEIALVVISVEKTRVPDVLYLVLIGFLLGPITGLVSIEAFGKVGNVFTVVALVIILFDSGLGLSFSTLRECMVPGIKLTVINFAVTVLVLDALFILMFKLSVLESLILGSILGGTSSAVVIPMVSRLHIKQNSATALILESTFSDVLCIVATLGFIQAIKYNELHPSIMLGHIISSFLLAAAIGVFAALFWSSILSRIRQLENSIFLTLAFIFIVFGTAELLGYSGAISALAFGVVLGNIQNLQHPLLKKVGFSRPVNLSKTEKIFFSEITFVVKIFFFVYVGISIRVTDLLLMTAGLVLTLVLLVIRIPVVRLALNTSVTKFDAHIAAIMVPKGLAAAVLASYIQQAGVEKSAIMQDVVYAVIFFSIIMATVLAFLVERGRLQKLYAPFFAKYTTENDSD